MSFLDKWLHWFSHTECKPDDDKHYYVTVGEGDTLSNIAEDLIGDGDRYPEIVAANPDRHFDAHFTVHVGEKLRVPKSWGEG
jgi:nucleoid-associated protein YgaU